MASLPRHSMPSRSLVIKELRDRGLTVLEIVKALETNERTVFRYLTAESELSTK
ncbi:MAG TPA: hypothetical protein V6C65_27015 [Allocoleopsis sp.]